MDGGEVAELELLTRALIGITLQSLEVLGAEVSLPQFRLLLAASTLGRAPSSRLAEAVGVPEEAWVGPRVASAIAAEPALASASATAVDAGAAAVVVVVAVVDVIVAVIIFLLCQLCYCCGYHSHGQMAPG